MGVEPTTFGLEVRRASPLRYGDYESIDDSQPLIAYRNDEFVSTRVLVDHHRVSFVRIASLA